MMDYNYIDESLENELNNLELPDEINHKIDKDYELDFSEDEIFNIEKNKNKNINLNKSLKKNQKNINVNNSGLPPTKNDGNLDQEFDIYLNDLDKKIEEEVLREELEKNKNEINLNRNLINLGNDNDIARANKIIEEDEAIRKAMEDKVLTFDDIVNYVDYYQIFSFVNKSQKLALDQFTKIADLCEKETFEETEDEIKKRIENTLKITDKILDNDQFSPKEIVYLDEKKRFFEEKQKEELKKKNEKEYIMKQNEQENKKFLQDLILKTRDKHIELDDVYENLDENEIQPEASEIKENDEKYMFVKHNKEKAINKLDRNEVEKIVDNDKEYQFLEKLTKTENYHRNMKIESKKINNRIFFVEKDLEDLENYKKGEVKNKNNFNEKSNPLHNFFDIENEPWLQKVLSKEDSEENYKNLVADLYKKHGLEYKEIKNNSSAILKYTNNINGKDNLVKNKLERLNQTIEGTDLYKKLGNSKKFIPPLKNKNLINSNTIVKLNQNNNNNILNNLIKNTNVDNTHDNELKSLISTSDANNVMKESLSKLSFRSKISSNTTNTNKVNPINNIDLFTTDNKMINLIKVRDQRKEYLKTKIGDKSNKRPDLFSFNAKHILINDKGDEGYDKIFEIIQEAKTKNKEDLCFLPNSSNSNFEVDKSIDSFNSKKSSVRKKIELAINYSKNKIY